jgi:tRNA (adenine57-N1/adenine58-N1)-methyltransferase
MSHEKIAPLMLMEEKGSIFMVWPSRGMSEIRGIGVVDLDKLAKKPIGSSIEIAGKTYVLLEASLLDILASIKRGPQWIMSKDSAQILVGCGLRPGKRVLEIGTGSGALTIVLAYYVGSEGKVVTYENNVKNAKLASKNIRRAGLADVVDVKVEDAIDCDMEKEFDAVVMDIPQPWDLLETAGRALKVSGHVCAYVPTMNQVESTIRALRESGYVGTRAVENLQREIVVGKGGTRPSFEMLGHTGYLCFGRKLKK